MNEEEAKGLAQQLRKPEGEFGVQVGERMNAGNQFMNRNTIEQLNVQPGHHILEIGMGNGFFVKEILEKDPSIQYTGCDFSTLMVKESIKMNQEWIERGQASFLHSTADHLPFEDHRFDSIFTINTLYFWEHLEKELAELRRVLKPDGKFVLTIRPKKYMEKLPFTQYGFQMYSRQEVVQLLQNHRWKVVEVIEKTDPPIDWFGEVMEPESLIIVCKTI